MERQDRSRLAGMALAIVACGALAVAQQTRPATTQTAATRKATTQKLEPPPGIQKLIERIAKSAKGDADAAAKLLAAAETLQDAPGAQVAICEAAYKYGIKDVAGRGSALKALDILDAADSGRAGIWAEKRVKIYRLRYAAATGKDKQTQAALLVSMLVKTGDHMFARVQAKEAAGFYREAVAITSRMRLPGRQEISAKLLAAVRLVQVQGALDRLKAKLAKDPGDKETRDILIRMYLVGQDSPVEAAKYVNNDCDESLRTHVPLATKPLAKLKDTECLALGRWYQLLSLKAAKDGKLKMLERGRSYLQRFLVIHSAKDAARTKVVMLLKQLDTQIAKLGGGLVALKGAVVVLTFERNTLFTKSGKKYIRDLSGKGHNGHVTGGALAPGKAGSAMKFDKKSHVNLGNPKDLQITGGQTICMWIKASSLASRQNPINKAYGGEGTWTLERDGGINYWYGSSGGDTQPYRGYKMSKPLAAGTWAHVATVRDMKTRKVTWYKDGAVVSTTTAAHSCTASRNSLLIGTGYTTGMSGMLDEVAIFNRALSAKEIVKIYRWGAQGRPLAR